MRTEIFASYKIHLLGHNLLGISYLFLNHHRNVNFAKLKQYISCATTIKNMLILANSVTYSISIDKQTKEQHR